MFLFSCRFNVHDKMVSSFFIARIKLLQPKMIIFISCEDVKIWCYKTTLASILVYWANLRIQVTKTKQAFSSWTNSETIIFVWFVLKRQQKENRRPFHFLWACLRSKYSSVGLNYKTFSYYDYVKWYRNILWENMSVLFK